MGMSKYAGISNLLLWSMTEHFAQRKWTRFVGLTCRFLDPFVETGASSMRRKECLRLSVMTRMLALMLSLSCVLTER